MYLHTYIHIPVLWRCCLACSTQEQVFSLLNLWLPLLPTRLCSELPRCVCVHFVWLFPNLVICASQNSLACTYVCMYVCTYVCMYVCMHVRMYACTYVCMYVCMYVRMYVCTYVCTYAQIVVYSWVHLTLQYMPTRILKSSFCVSSCLHS